MSRWWLLFALATGCGGEVLTDGEVSLAAEYDVVGAGRVTDQRGSIIGLRPVELQLEEVQASNGRVFGLLSGTGTTTGKQIGFEGDFDRAQRRIAIDPLEGALTATVSEHLTAFVMELEDALPADAVADHLTGFLRAEQGGNSFASALFGTARRPQRPEPLVESRITAQVKALGRITLVGAPGSAMGRGGIEILRFTRARPEPDVTLTQADASGAFAVTVDGLEEDIFILRAQNAGRTSHGIFVVAKPD